MNPFEEKGRYYKNVKQLREIFSEENYYFECYKLEVILLVNILQNFKDIVFYHGKYDTSKFDSYIEYLLGKISDNEQNKAGLLLKIKDLEVSTRHDIVAVQRYVESELSFIIFSYSDDLPDSKEFKDQYLINFVHFGLTSQDIVNTVYTKLINKANEVIRLEFYSLHAFMYSLASNKLMLSFTHGQPAVPMEISHFIKVHSSKISDIINEIVNIDYIVKVKFGTGAVGNGFSLSKTTCNNEKLSEAYRYTVSEFLEFKLANTIDSPSFQNNNCPIVLDKFPQLKNLSNTLIDLSVDMWLYCSKGYLKRKTDINETGSSTMPQKINPINFENAEGNLKLACSLFDSFTDNLAKSRLQRDLSDVTMMRSVGMCYAYLLQGMTSLKSGFEQYEFDKKLVTKELNENVQVFSEFIQIQMKLDGYSSPYSSMKKLSIEHPTWRIQDFYNPKGEFLSIPQYIVDKIILILEKNATTNPDNN